MHEKLDLLQVHFFKFGDLAYFSMLMHIDFLFFFFLKIAYFSLP